MSRKREPFERKRETPTPTLNTNTPRGHPEDTKRIHKDEPDGTDGPDPLPGPVHPGKIRRIFVPSRLRVQRRFRVFARRVPACGTFRVLKQSEPRQLAAPLPFEAHR